MKEFAKKVINKLSTIDIDVKENYELARKFDSIAHYHYFKKLYKYADSEIDLGTHKVPIRIFYPKDDSKNKKKMLLFFHGGGWVTGDIDSYNKTCVRLTQITGYLVVSVDYRLAPEFPYPAGLLDCYGVYKAFTIHNEFNVKKKNIVVMGDSAGGNLAAALSLLARDRKEYIPRKQILIYPATHSDHSENSPYESVHRNGEKWILTTKRVNDYISMYVNYVEDLQSPYVAPLLACSFKKQPKTLIITAEYDPLRDEGEDYGKKLKEAKNKVVIKRIPEGIHGFFSLPFQTEEITMTYKYIKAFLNGDDVK